MSIWQGESKSKLKEELKPSKISGSRRLQHSDLSRLEHLIRPTTRQLFGDVNVERIYETCCLSIVEHNDRRDIVSGICLCTYPNVPSVPPYDWLTWLRTIYRIPAATERNTMFVHLLVWDERYSNEFLAGLLAAIFDQTTYCQYVILVVPPRVTLANWSVFEREMTRVLANTAVRDAQFLYLADRSRLRPKLKIRRVVEEDHDDVRAIIDERMTYLKELHGEYCIIEMIRRPDSCRRFIIGEDPIDGSAVGVVCLNSVIDIDLLNENFELTPYDGLTKPRRDSGQLSAAEPDDDPDALFPQPSEHSRETNVFALEIFATRHGTRPAYFHDFLVAAFDCFPHLEYCAVLLSFAHPSSHFLQHFVRVPLRCNRDFPMTLYVVHRAIFGEDIRCRRARIQDREAIERLLFAMTTRREVLADFDLTMDPLRLDLDCLVFENNDTMLGLAILCAEKQINLVTDYYHIEDYVSVQSVSQQDYGRLLHFVLMPIFSTLHRFFVREIARLSELTVIFYRLRHEDESTVTYPLASCLSDMIPVDPRRQAEYRFPIVRENLGNYENNANDKTDECKPGRFSLFVTSPRLAMMPRVRCDARIVVVGASDCGIAFADYLAVRSMQRYTQMTNFTLISPHGIPFDNVSNGAEAYLLPFRGRFHSGYRRCMTARLWVTIVCGSMITINRKEKYVSVLNQGNIAYDYLILTCGLQYQNSTLREIMQERKSNKMPDQIPWNCLTVNDDTEAAACLRKIEWLTGGLRERKAIFLYGRNIECYCALGGLIKLGVKPSWITLIEPRETNDQAFFHDYQVNEAVTTAILQNGIQVLSAWNLIDWALIENDDAELMIVSVTIEKEGEMKKLACDIFFNFYEKTIDSNAFLAFCQAGLIFDGSLIIDPECRTNDPFIFAAGTMTRYSRKFHADAWQHKYYNSMEIGERLAEILWKAIESNERVAERAPKKEKIMYLTPSLFRAPTVIACILPGDYYYLHVRGPRVARWRNTKKMTRNGQIFITGSCESEIGYFRIRLNMCDTVESVTCVSRKTFRPRDMIALCGKHESMLNDVKIRFRNSYISDFYAYFREPWAAAILHDSVDCLRVENQATLLSRRQRKDAVHDDDSLVGDCVRALIASKWQTELRTHESASASALVNLKIQAITSAAFQLNVFEKSNMLKSYPTRYPISRAGTSSTGTRVIRLTVDQEAVLQEQFNRWPRAPYTADVILLAAETGLSEADVEVWYGIRLAQWRKEQGLGGSILGLH